MITGGIIPHSIFEVAIPPFSCNTIRIWAFPAS